MTLKENKQTMEEIINKYKQYGVEEFIVYDLNEFCFPDDEIDITESNYVISFSEKYVGLYI